MRAPIVSRKHYVQFTQYTVDSATVTTHVPVEGVAIQNVNTNSEVVEGSVIKAIFIEMWLQGAATSLSTFIVVVEKLTQGAGSITFSQATTLDAYANKKNVLFVSQGVLAPNQGNPTPVLRQWLKIPKGKQRFGLGDKLEISIISIGSNDILGCEFEVYKSYT